MKKSEIERYVHMRYLITTWMLPLFYHIHITTKTQDKMVPLLLKKHIRNLSKKEYLNCIEDLNHFVIRSFISKGLFYSYFWS